MIVSFPAGIQPDAVITLLVLAGSVLLFVSGWLAPEVTCLLAAGLLIATGVLSPAEPLRGFGSPAVITLIGLFALSAGLFRAGGLDRLRALLGSDAIRSPRRMILLVTTVVGPVSAFVPNTPIVAALLPVLESWCQRRGISPSKVLLPLSFATVLGGTLTLIGSSVNLLASEVSERMGYGALGLLSFSPIGIGVWLSGSLVMVLLADRLLPDRGRNDDDLVADLASSGYLTEVDIPQRSELIGQSLHDSRLQRRFDVDVLEVHRGRERILPPLAGHTLELGDRLLLRCSRNDLLRLQQERTVEVLLSSGSALTRNSLGNLRFRQRYNATVLALRRGNQVVREWLGQVVVQEGGCAVVAGPQGRHPGPAGQQRPGGARTTGEGSTHCESQAGGDCHQRAGGAAGWAGVVALGGCRAARQTGDGGHRLPAAGGTAAGNPTRRDPAAGVAGQFQRGPRENRSGWSPGRGADAGSYWLAGLRCPSERVSVHHSAHRSGEQRHSRRPADSRGGGAGRGAGAAAPRFRLSRALRSEPELSEPGRLPDEPDGVRPRPVQISGYHPLWTPSHVHHDPGCTPADLSTLQPLGTAPRALVPSTDVSAAPPQGHAKPFLRQLRCG